MSKDVLNVVKKKTGKSVTPKDIQKLASGVKPSTLQSEAQLRQLIKQVSGLVNVKVSEETINEIVHAVKSSKLDTNNMQQLMQMMMGKK
ncbi:stage VI sporulation protein F [Paenibacillus sedimenti]|nr:stage VI sporulation protein F [Paenibacillus sedimenti]